MRFTICLFVTFMSIQSFTQKIIDLPKTDDGHEWRTAEREYFTEDWQNSVITNVSQAQLHAFIPEKPNGTAVIIAPGGAMYALSIDSEGRDVAKWLTQKGITAFVLKYRLVPTGEDGVKDMNDDGNNVEVKARKILPFAVEDAMNAIQHIRSNSISYGVNPSKIGLIGFSAGGAVTMTTRYQCQDYQCPDFIGPIYAWMNIVDVQQIDKTAKPIFVACAQDDPLDLAPATVALYQQWNSAGLPAELHLYAKGGHGFGMNKQGLPSDQWIQHFYDWMVAEGLVE